MPHVAHNTGAPFNGLTILPSIFLVLQKEEAANSREDYMEIFCAALQRPGAHALTQSNAPW